MVTLANAIASKSNKLIPLIRVEGVGQFSTGDDARDGLWSFCPKTPSYAAEDAGSPCSYTQALAWDTGNDENAEHGTETAGTFDVGAALAGQTYVTMLVRCRSPVGGGAWAGGNTAGYVCSIRPASGLEIQRQGGDVSADCTGVFRFGNTNAITVSNAFLHDTDMVFVFVYDGSLDTDDAVALRTKIYRNKSVINTADGVAPSTWPSSASSYPFRINRRDGTPTTSFGNFGGVTGNIAIWVGQAATQAQVDEITDCHDLNCSDLGAPDYWWKCGDGENDTSSSLDNYGTGTNGQITLSALEGNEFIAWAPTSTCTGTPAYYKPWLTEEGLPGLSAERVDPDGGIVTAGDIEFAVTDGHDGDKDALTALLKTDAAPATLLTTNITATQTSFDVDDGTALSESSVIYINDEAIFVDSIASNTLTVRRAKLGTTGQKHSAADGVYTGLPNLAGREIKLLLTDIDADDRDEERQIGPGYFLDRLKLSTEAGFGVYELGGRSSLRYLAREVPQVVRSGTIHDITTDDRIFLDRSNPQDGGELALASDLSGMHIKTGDQVRLVAVDEAGALKWSDLRGSAWTRAANVGLGDLVTQVCSLPAVGTAVVDYGWSPGTNFGGTAETDRTGTWNPTKNPVDIILNHLVSSHDPNTDNVGTNFDATYGNWARLKPGFGAGIPYTSIDWDSFMDVRERFADVTLEKWVMGEESQSVAALISPILQLLRGMLINRDQKLALVVDRLPLVGETTAASLGADDILADLAGQNDGAALRPRFSASLNFDQKSAIRWIVGTEKGEEAILLVRNATFGGAIKRNDNPANDEGAVEIEAPFMLAGSGGSVPALERLSERRLYRRRRPPWDIDADMPMTQEGLEPGDRIDLTLNQLPNFATGGRDWSAVHLQMLSRRPVFAPDEAPHMEMTMQSFGPTTLVGKISAAAHVASVSVNTATVTANRYTQTDTTLSAQNDAAAFAVDDVCKLIDAGGVEVTATTQTITGISGNDITFDGNFGGSLAAATIIVFADRDDADAQQYTAYTYFADESDRTIGASSDAPWRYGEP